LTPADAAQVQIIPFEKTLEHPFGISSSTIATSQSILVRIGDAWGEASSTGNPDESRDDSAAILERWVGEIPTDGRDPGEFLDRFEREEPGKSGAKGAIDMVLHDRWARAQGLPLRKLWSIDPADMPVSSFTIGIDEIDVMLEKIETAGSKSPVLKIKLGRDPDGDAEIMRQIRRAAPNKILRVDANQGWSLHDARRLAPVMADLGVEYIEQPLKRGEIEACKTLKRNCPLPIFLDEDARVAADIPRLADACDGVNIKLMKTGGLREARAMIAAARERGLQLMLGCMIETSVGITAAAQIAPLFDHIDLDGHILISNDPFDGCGWDNGKLTLSDKPGIGVSLKPGQSL
jgi:L-alanine-DL-glutamate epimerase-like enolase superfamily enzyme